MALTPLLTFDQRWFPKTSEGIEQAFNYSFALQELRLVDRSRPYGVIQNAKANVLRIAEAQPDEARLALLRALDHYECNLDQPSRAYDERRDLEPSFNCVVYLTSPPFVCEEVTGNCSLRLEAPTKEGLADLRGAVAGAR